jgi:hypothetical protein
MCLRSGCNSGQYNGDEESHKMVCAICQFATCTHHGMAWHTGQTCEEFGSDIKEILDEALRQKALQERKDAEEREAKRQQEIAAEATRQEAARQKAPADVATLKRRHAIDNKASLATVKDIAKTCPNLSCRVKI